MAETPAPSAESTDAAAYAETPERREQRLAEEAEREKGFLATAEKTDANFVMRFPWKERVSAAAFVRGGYAWIVFGKAAVVDTAAISTALAAKDRRVNQLTAAGATVLRVPMQEYAGIAVARGDDKSKDAWTISLELVARSPETPLSVESNPDAAQPYVLIAALEADGTVAVEDPDTGDALLVAPSFKPGEGVATARGFVDFSVMGSTQGIAVQKFSDDVRIIDARNGVRISTQGGAALSANLPPPQPAAGAPPDPNLTLFPYDQWKVEGDVKAKNKAVADWLKQIADAPQPSAANAARLKLAQYYLSEGLSTEALGVLRQIERTEPDFYKNTRLSAMTGAANFLLSRYQDAASAFAAKELDGLPEVHYWRAMLSDLLGNPDAPFDYMANREAYINHYPPSLRQRLAILAADRAVAAKAHNNALQILDELNQAGLAEGIIDYVNYLTGKISVETGHAEEGIALWEKLLENLDNTAVRARADYSLIAEYLKSGTLTKDQAIDRLERLTLNWRGDALEMNALNLLAELYADKGDMPSAMRVWRNITLAFPGTAIAQEAGRKMRDAFIALFEKPEAEEAQTMSVLDRMFLFNEFRDLVPTDEVGDRLVDTMVAQMVELDLLDEAAALLEQRMRYKFEREKRSETGAKLAGIYLLNRQPAEALKTLQDSAYGDNAPGTAKTRNYLAAQALIGTKQIESAMALLKGDDSAEAHAIRLEAHWQMKDWPNIISTIEAMLKKRNDPAAPLSPAEAHRVAQLALAYAATGDAAQLSYLRDYFMPLMEGAAEKPLFEFITRPELPVTPENFEETMKAFADTRELLGGFAAKKE